MGLRDSIPVGTTMTMSAGSAAQVLLAWEEPDRMHEILETARFTAADLVRVREQGYAESAGEREAGVAGVSAPVWGTAGRVIAALSISGPIARLTGHPAERHALDVTDAARRLSDILHRTET
jgi:DNA-binding IclR family transcriptional regulator